MKVLKGENSRENVAFNWGVDGHCENSYVLWHSLTFYSFSFWLSVLALLSFNPSHACTVLFPLFQGFSETSHLLSFSYLRHLLSFPWFPQSLHHLHIVVLVPPLILFPIATIPMLSTQHACSRNFPMVIGILSECLQFCFDCVKVFWDFPLPLKETRICLFECKERVLDMLEAWWNQLEDIPMNQKGAREIDDDECIDDPPIDHTAVSSCWTCISSWWLQLSSWVHNGIGTWK